MATVTATHCPEDRTSDLLSAVRRILAGAGHPDAGLEVVPLTAGGNNRVYLISTARRSFVAKWYYDDAAVFRERMRAEYEFLAHASSHGITSVPRAIGRDTEMQVAVYEKISGTRPKADELTAGHVTEAARFFAELNAPAVRATGGHLQAASDACFSIADHIESVELRLTRLAGVKPVTTEDRAAAELVVALGVAWDRVKHRLAAAGREGVLPDSWRCLSPSDFGFHNALMRDDGTLCFLDFEYAGWDDPAKMIGDFFSHPGAAVPNEYLEIFTAVALDPFPEAQAIAARSRELMGVARIRWCCIVLNEFLPQVASRRQFADPGSDPEERKRRQLEKAESMLSRIIS